MRNETLNRQEALGLIEGAESDSDMLSSLLDLQQHWIGHRDYDASASTDDIAQMLAEYVDASASPRRDGFPRANDPTGLTIPPSWE